MNLLKPLGMYSKDEARQLRKDFWIAFSNYTKFYERKVGVPIDWILYKTGIKGLEFKFEIENKYIVVMLEVNASSEDRRFNIFVELDKYKMILSEGFSGELMWDENFQMAENKIVSRVSVELQGVKYHNMDNWPTIFQFMAENMFCLQMNFEDIQDILKDKFTTSFV